MKFFLSLIFLYLICLSQSFTKENLGQEIPATIEQDMILKPTAKPYVCKGFTVLKDKTLTLLPGVIIELVAQEKTPINIFVEGTLIIGNTKAPSSKPVVITGGTGAWLHVKSGGLLEANGLEIEVTRFQLFRGSNATVKNSKFIRNERTIPYTVNIVPTTKTNIILENCLFEDQGLDIDSKDFPENIDNFKMTKCSFTARFDEKTKKLSVRKITSLALLYGTNCDAHINWTFEAFPGELKKPVASQWYIADKSQAEILGNSAKSLKGLVFKASSRPFTKYIQEKEPQKKK